MSKTQTNMKPKEGSAEVSEQDAYAKIVADVKAREAKKPPGSVTGDQVSWEIAKRWATHKGRPFAQPYPHGPGKLGSTAASPPPSTHKVGPIKSSSGEGVKPGLPEEEKTDDED